MEILVSLLAIAIVITVHEYGHLYYAKKFGLEVPVFSIGFGQEIFGWFRKGTRYSVGWIPFGGYVELDPEKVSELPRREQVWISMGGPLANLYLCLVIGIVTLLFVGPSAEVAFGERSFSYAELWLWLLIGVPIFFFAAVPMTLYFLLELLFTFDFASEDVAGPIGIVSGSFIPAEAMEFPLGFVILGATFVLSFSIGSLNLIPLSILDGGRIMSLYLEKYELAHKIWSYSTHAIFAFLVIFLIGGDIFKLVT